MSSSPHSRAKQVFLEALARPDHERARFLAEACGDDPALREEVESLLNWHVTESTGAFVRASSDPPSPERFSSGDLFANRYRIIARLGVGGMGEVWRAHDTVLDVSVALKLIHGSSEAGRSRLLNEARLARKITHPSVCRVFDVGEANGEVFLSMEFVDGEDLRSLLRRVRRLPPEKVVEIARHLCGALAAAHTHGVLHRDLKPANILMDAEGRVRITDFGIATATVAPAEGILVGTPGYLAPEQLEPGRRLSEQTDLYALGLVLFELLAGRPALDGAPRAATSRRAEDLRFPPDTHPQLERVILQALALDPQDRPASALDFASQLPGVDAASVAIDAGLTPSPRIGGPLDAHRGIGEESDSVKGTSLSRRLMKAVGALAVLAVLAIMLTRWTKSPALPDPIGHFIISAHHLILTTLQLDITISPDGQRIVYVGEAPNRLLVRRLEDPLPTPLDVQGSDAQTPFFSPDSEWVGFFSAGAIKKVSVRGGPTVTICNIAGGGLRGASWGSNDTIIFALADLSTGLMRVSASGGAPETLTIPDRKAGELDHLWPEILPDGKAVLFTITVPGSGALPDGQIAVRSLETGETKVLIPGASPRFAPTGHIVYAANGALMAVRFDSRRLEIVGNPQPVLDGIVQKSTLGADFGFSKNGSLAYVAGALGVRMGSRRRLAWIDRRGQTQPLDLPPGVYDSPSLSPDGKKLALVIADASGTNVSVYDLERRILSKRTFEGVNRFPVWTPDGKHLVYASGSGFESLARVAADGGGAAELLLTEDDLPGLKVPTGQSPDGTVLMFRYNSATWMLRLDGKKKAQRFIEHDTATVRDARFSPNGKWIAYRSDETGRDEVYVRPYAEPGGKWQISTGGGAQPMWSSSGRELFYKRGYQLMVAEVKTEPTFDYRTPRVVFDHPLRETFPGELSRYGVSPDGQRFLILEPADQEGAEPSPEIHVIVNWFQELERLDRPGK